MHVKLALVLLLIGYHVWCGMLYLQFSGGRESRSHVWFRWFNEFPVLLLAAIVVLVVVKPF
jgi:putative membrane protein